MNVKFPKKKFKSARSVKNYIGSNYKSHTDFLIKNGFIVDKCIFCERYADTIVEIKEDKENWYIDSFVYYRGNKVCRDKNCVCSSLNPQSKEWLVKVKGFSEDDVKKKLETKAKKSAKKQKENGRFDNINNSFSKLYWTSRGYTEEEASNILKEKSKKTVNTLRKKGWFDDKSNNPFSKDYWIKKGMSEEETELKVNSRIYNRPEFWIERGYSIEDAKKLSKNSAKRDLKHYIEKYGYEEGNRRYNNVRSIISSYYKIDEIMRREGCSFDEANTIRENWIKKTHNGKNSKFSKASMLYFENLLLDINLSDELFEKTYYAENEFGHYDKILKKYYFYDFVIEPLKICIEYNGIVWHPKSPNQNWVQPNTNMTAKEVYDNDLRKRKILEDIGYKCFVVWDDDLENNRNEIIETIKNKIKDYERGKLNEI